MCLTTLTRVRVKLGLTPGGVSGCRSSISSAERGLAMSIEFSPAFDRGTNTSPVKPTATAAELKKRLRRKGPGRAERATKVSAARVAANRRNAQRSTGPRTQAGKRRASRNALKHGMCSTSACLAGECPAAYATALREIEEELQPRTTLQRALLPLIANLLWRIDRLPQAQADLFQRELKKCGRGKTLSASEILARRFSDEPANNGFLLMGRYERGLHGQLHRLMSRYEWLKKHRALMPPDEDEARAARRAHEAKVDAYVRACSRRINAETAESEARAAAARAQENAAARAEKIATTAAAAAKRDPKRTQSNPTQTR